MKRFSTRLHLAVFIMLSISFLLGCKKGGGDEEMPDPDGNWQVTVVPSGHCLAPAGSKIIQVSGGNFDAVIMTFTKSGCTQTISVKGTITKGNINYVVSGNEFLAGNCCNGGNGFFAYINPFATTVKGTVASNWGSLEFEKK